jgi:hypothetical protein
MEGGDSRQNWETQMQAGIASVMGCTRSLRKQLCGAKLRAAYVFQMIRI